MALFYLGGAAAVVALAVAYWGGGTVKRTAGLLGAWAGLTLAWLIVIYLSAPRTDRPGGCSDCSDHLGRWIDTSAIFVVVGANVVAWTLATLVGSGLRGLRPRKRERP